MLHLGDTTPPTAVLSQTGPALAKYAAIVVRFSEAMNPGSLQLGGTLVADSSGGVWSKTSADNDTLTLAPKSGGWTIGPGRTLNVDAKDLAGNALASLKTSYGVGLALDTFQDAAVVIGQANFAGWLPNQGAAPGANTLDLPYGTPGVTNSLPTANNANADFVLGQPDFSTTTELIEQGRHVGPQQVIEAGGKLVVVDYSANRIVIYNTCQQAQRPCRAWWSARRASCQVARLAPQPGCTTRKKRQSRPTHSSYDTETHRSSDPADSASAAGDLHVHTASLVAPRGRGLPLDRRRFAAP